MAEHHQQVCHLRLRDGISVGFVLLPRIDVLDQAANHLQWSADKLLRRVVNSQWGVGHPQVDVIPVGYGSSEKLSKILELLVRI